MKEEQGSTLVINIYLSRGLTIFLTLTLLLAFSITFLAWTQNKAEASRLQAPVSSVENLPQAVSGPMRHYYLGGAVINAAQALSACTTGYHMASLWELLDTSNLAYNASLGLWQGDSAPGPPTVWQGWVRTGYNSSDANIPGRANCNAWSADTGYGTTAGLPSDWETGLEDIHVWAVSTSACSLPAKVWCVED